MSLLSPRDSKKDLDEFLKKNTYRDLDFAYLFTMGLSDDELKEILPPADLADYKKFAAGIEEK